jgi:hypothetical protein
MRLTAIFRVLAKHSNPVFLELPPKGNLHYRQHAIAGHKLCCERQHGIRLIGSWFVRTPLFPMELLRCFTMCTRWR